MSPNYYDLLGLRSDATSDEIRTAYRKLARTVHPDTNSAGSASAGMFVLLQEAYETLIDPTRRAGHDRVLRGEAAQANSSPQPQHNGPASETARADPFSEPTRQWWEEHIDGDAEPRRTTPPSTASSEQKQNVSGASGFFASTNALTICSWLALGLGLVGHYHGLYGFVFGTLFRLPLRPEDYAVDPPGGGWIVLLIAASWVASVMVHTAVDLRARIYGAPSSASVLLLLASVTVGVFSTPTDASNPILISLMYVGLLGAWTTVFPAINLLLGTWRRRGGPRAAVGSIG